MLKQQLAGVVSLLPRGPTKKDLVGARNHRRGKVYPWLLAEHLAIDRWVHCLRKTFIEKSPTAK